MKLTAEDGQLFYKLWMPLLDFVNRRNKVNPALKKMAGATLLEPAEVFKVADYLWDHTEEIDAYLKSVKDLPEEHRSIIAGWKNCVRGTFIVERHLKKGSILLGEDNRVYLVNGIISSWDELLYGIALPVMIRATLIPWKDIIIQDGLIQRYPVIIGPNAKRGFKDQYMQAKEAGNIITSLPAAVKPDDKKRTEKENEKRGPADTVKKPKSTGKAKGPELIVNRYRCKVYPPGCSRDIYREIAISGNETLDRLAEFILDSFDFSDEHLYEFCMDNRMYSPNSYQSEPGPGEPSTRKKLDALGLVKGQNFLFHYDFGDDWQFVIHVQSITAEKRRAPELLRSKGELEQYPDWDDEDDEEDDDDLE